GRDDDGGAVSRPVARGRGAVLVSTRRAGHDSGRARRARRLLDREHGPHRHSRAAARYGAVGAHGPCLHPLLLEMADALRSLALRRLSPRLGRSAVHPRALMGPPSGVPTCRRLPYAQRVTARSSNIWRHAVLGAWVISAAAVLTNAA